MAAEASIYGACADTYGAFTGRSAAFSEMVDGVSRLKKLGIPVSGKVTVNKLNYREIRDIVKLGQFLDVHLVVSWRTSQGRAANALPPHLDPTQFRESFVDALETGLFWSGGPPLKPDLPCKAFRTWITVSWNGDVRCCPTSSDCAGSIRNEPLESLIANQYFRCRQDCLPESFECSKCNIADDCISGCPEEALSETGDLCRCPPSARLQAEIVRDIMVARGVGGYSNP